ncbi:MAG: hypothetical protein JO276_05580, partial [Sphingomonadaceae bacterium]|nr:hypothetical protein [Sphingomonadaceae bacterium]
MNEATGFQRRAQAAVELYERNRRSYARMARHVHDTLRDKCDPAGIHTIEHRAKDIGSFRTKALKGDGEGGRYRDPINEITDLAGVRVIVFLRETVNSVCKIIASTYDIIEQEDVGERTFKQGRFGYQSIHLLVALDKRQYIGNDGDIKRAICEIQVRTILQHAWAEMEHDIQYKG